MRITESLGLGSGTCQAVEAPAGVLKAGVV